MSDKADFYYCQNCRINFETKNCPRCGRKGVPAKLPFERDYSNDPSYLDYVKKESSNNGKL